MTENKKIYVGFEQGSGLLSLIVQFIIWIRYGFKRKAIASHVVIYNYKNKNQDQDQDVHSSEIGVNIRKAKKRAKKRIVFSIEVEKKDYLNSIKFIESALKNSVKYAFARYIQDFARVGAFYSFLSSAFCFSLLLFKIKSLEFGVLFLLITAFLSFIFIIFKKMDLKTYDCSEFASLVLKEANFLIPIKNRARDSSPDQLLFLFKNFYKHGLANLEECTYQEFLK